MAGGPSKAQFNVGAPSKCLSFAAALNRCITPMDSADVPFLE